MQKKDMNKMRMYNQVVLIISEHEAIWQSNVPFTEVYNTFTSKLDSLKTDIDAQFSLKGAHSIQKRKTKEVLFNDALRIQNLLTFFAAKTENKVLLQQVKKPASFWNRLSETNFLAQCERLGSILEEHLPDVVDYGLSQVDLDGFNAKIEDFVTAIGEPRSAVIHRTHVTSNIEAAMDELDALLKLQLDTFVHALAATQSKFVNLYDHARDVIRYKGKGHTDSDSPQIPADEV